MADQVNFPQLATLIGRSPVGIQAGEGSAVANMTVSGSVGLTVVDGSPFQLRIQLTGPIPVASERADHSGVSAIAIPIEHLLHIAETAPVLEAEQFIPAPAHEAVNQRQRIAIAVVARSSQGRNDQ